MKVNGNQINPGNIIMHNNRLWRAVKTQAVKPGKGGAFAQIELKDIKTGTKLNERFRATETIERISLEQQDYQYLFEDAGLITLMDPETFDQISVDKNTILEEQYPFLTDGLMVEVESYEDDIISVSLPKQMIVEIAEADAVVKGQTASSSYKNAILTNGLKILVPPHIASGTKVKVDTLTHEYLEKAKG